MGEDVASEVRRKITNILTKARLPPSNLSPDEKRALKSLRKRDGVVILPADKGRATVIMDRCDYDEKMNRMIKEGDTYKELSRDPVQSVERKMNAMLLRMKKQGSIQPELYNRLRSSGG